MKNLPVIPYSLVLLVSALTGSAQVYEQSRQGGATQTNNADFSFPGSTFSTSANKSTATGQPAGSTSSRFIVTPATTSAICTLSPNRLSTQLVSGTTYAVAVTFPNSGSSGQKESTDVVVTTSDTGCTGNDTFVGSTTAFQQGNGVNTWVPVGNVTISSASPTFTFTWQSGANVNRWYIDTVRFTALPPGPTAQYWDTGTPGGSGTWDTTTLNWNPNSDGSGTPAVFNQADLAVFGGTAGTVSIDPVNGVTTDGGLEFDTTGYIVQSGTLTLGNGTNIAVVGPASAAAMNSEIDSTNGLCTTGSGTLLLNASNSIAGTVTLTAGTLGLGTNQTFDSLAGISAGKLSLLTNTLTLNGTNSTTCAAAITDSGAATPGYLVKSGPAVQTLTGSSTYHGQTIITGGALTITADAALGAAPASVVADQLTLSNAARLDFSAAFTVNVNRGITLGAGDGLLSTGGTGTTPTIPGTISGSGNLIIPTGAFDLTGTNTFTGNIYLVGTNVDATGNGLSSLRFDSTAASGAGKIFLMPGNGKNVTLRTFTYTNSIVTNAVEFDPFPGSGLYLSGAVAAGKLCTLTLSGNFNGTGGVIAGLTTSGGSSNPGGTVALYGENSAWSGGLTLQYGNLALGSPTALGTGTFNIDAIDSGASLVLMALTPLTGASALTNHTTVNLAGGTFFTFGGTNDLELSGPMTLVTSPTLTTTNTGRTIISGPIGTNAFTAGLTTAGSGTLTLSGANTYDGGTFISAGTLKVNNSTGSGTGPGPVVVMFGGTLSGNGTIAGTVQVDGTISPGNSPGALATADETWDPGGIYTWEINRASGAPGADPGWDRLNITGGLTMFTGFTVNLTSLAPDNTPGAVSDFDNTRSYTWSIAHTSAGVTGFGPGVITLNTAGFANPLGKGVFLLSTNSTDLLLSFAAPPNVTSIHVDPVGHTVSLSGTNGAANLTYRVLTSTDVTVPVATWSQVGSGTFANDGSFSFSGAINPADAQRYYAIVVP